MIPPSLCHLIPFALRTHIVGIPQIFSAQLVKKICTLKWEWKWITFACWLFNRKEFHSRSDSRKNRLYLSPPKINPISLLISKFHFYPASHLKPSASRKYDHSDFDHEPSMHVPIAPIKLLYIIIPTCQHGQRDPPYSSWWSELSQAQAHTSIMMQDMVLLINFCCEN